MELFFQYWVDSRDLFMLAIFNRYDEWWFWILEIWLFGFYFVIWMRPEEDL